MPWTWVALTTCYSTAGLCFKQRGGEALQFIYFSFPHMHFWNEVEKPSRWFQADRYFSEVLAFTYSLRATRCTDTLSPCSPANRAGSLMPVSFKWVKFPRLKPNPTGATCESKQVLHRQLGARFSSELPSSLHGVHGESTGIIPLVPAPYSPSSCSALLYAAEWEIKRQERRKGAGTKGHPAVFRFSPAGSLVALFSTLVFRKTQRCSLDGNSSKT